MVMPYTMYFLTTAKTVMINKMKGYEVNERSN